MLDKMLLMFVSVAVLILALTVSEVSSKGV